MSTKPLFIVHILSYRLRLLQRFLMSLMLVAFVPLAQAQVYKCTDANGNTTYADAPCATGSRKLPIQDDAKAGAGNPTVCAQLIDERRRLDAEAKRSANHGHPASASLARQRARVVAQYQRRCASVSR